MKKINVAVIFGGTNTEHEVSLVSALSVIKNLDKSKYTVLPVMITKDNRWLTTPKLIGENTSLTYLPDIIDASKSITPQQLTASNHIDVIFPVLHGPYGEDGTIQGLLELLHIPYVGNSVLSSAICMDKDVQKRLCIQAGIPVPNYKTLKSSEWVINPNRILKQLNSLIYPVFVKPANQGSSVGVSKADSPGQLAKAIKHAFSFDSKVLIETAIPNAREIECSVLGNDDPKASPLGEIIPGNEFYDYDAKYIDGTSKAIIPAKLSKTLTKKIQDYAIQAFKTLDCYGLARVDFLLDDQTNECFINELNTMPGFTSISMYPKLWAASGLEYSQLLDQLISLALKRFRQQSKLTSFFTPKTKWHQQ